MTSPVTDAELRAAALAIWDAYPEALPAWDELPKCKGGNHIPDRKEFLRMARHALDAAALERADAVPIARMTDDAELVREALKLAQVWAPSEWDNADTCLVRDAKEALSRLTARLDAERWQPIETAPAYTDIIGCVRSSGGKSWHYAVCSYVIFEDERLFANWSWGGDPTHWRPLPTPPETDNG